MVSTFQQAFAAAAQRFSPELWHALAPAYRTAAIYEEMRRLDASLNMKTVNLIVRNELHAQHATDRRRTT